MNTFISDISGTEFPVQEKILGTSIRLSILGFIQRSNPEFISGSSLSITELNYFRERFIAEYLVNEIGELTDLENTVLSTMRGKTTITDKIIEKAHDSSTLGQRVADKVATFGGSWTFIISFGVFLVIWISINAFVLLNKGFDPYPFILLNLILSCIAAMQAPVIMMSQNRQEEKDRERSKQDYMINLKSELEIRILHEKLDHLIMHQQQELLEIQKVQITMMQDILDHVNK